jgi:ion channel-forming bestrophin family protein
MVNGIPWIAVLLRVARRLVWWLVAITGYCVVVGLIVEEFSLPPVPWEAEATIANALIVGVLLAFRDRAAYDRWWEGRRLWGQLINDSRNLAWKIRAYLPAETVVRWRVAAVLPGFAEALKRHLRGRVRLQEIAGFEKDAEAPAHVPSHLAGQLMMGLAAWQRERLIDGTTALVLDVHARALLDICGACERIGNTGLPSSHKAILWFGIVLNVVIAPWYTLATLSWWGIPVILLVSFFLLGITAADAIIEEPFGTDSDDLDLDGYCATIRGSVEAILG